jgi:hypothetical protein
LKHVLSGRSNIDLFFQHRVDQETIYLKDEQLKVWIARVQEMDALHSNANHSLQAELRDRTEQYNQLWLGCQRQVVCFLHPLHFFSVLGLYHLGLMCVHVCACVFAACMHLFACISVCDILLYSFN